jgi:hypothetical protein
MSHLLFAPLLEGHLCFERLTCGRCHGITVPAILATFIGVVSQMGATHFLQRWKNFAGLTFVGTRSPGSLDAECFLGLPLVLVEADDASFAFALWFAWCFSFMTYSIASRSSRRTSENLGSVECVMLYWFTQVTGTELQMIQARSASSNGTLLFFVPSTAIDES